MAIGILALDAFCHVFLRRHLRRLRDAQSQANGSDSYWRWRATGDAEETVFDLMHLPWIGPMVVTHLSRPSSRYARILECVL